MVKQKTASYSTTDGNEITFTFNNSDEDRKLINQINELIRNQPTCWNCANCRDTGMMCGYRAHECIIHGNIEALDHPHHNCDGSQCDDYRRINE